MSQTTEYDRYILGQDLDEPHRQVSRFIYEKALKHMKAVDNKLTEKTGIKDAVKALPEMAVTGGLLNISFAVGLIEVTVHALNKKIQI